MACKGNSIENFFTLMIMLVFRIGSNNIPVPGINNRDYLAQMFQGQTGFDLFDLFSGGAFSNFTIFALYHSVCNRFSIIVQLLTIVLFHTSKDFSKEGNKGRKKMKTITRYLTVVLD